MLFESICNSQWFIHTSIILFLNKIDLFKEKLLSSPVRRYFPDYIGEPKSYKNASLYFQESFTRLNRNSSKVRIPPLTSLKSWLYPEPILQFLQDIYVHFTNATDTNLLKITMMSVQDMILQKNLKVLVL